MRKAWILLILIFFSCPVLMAEENQLLSYKSFIDYAEAGQIKSAIIGDFDYMKEIEVVVVKNGTEQTYFVHRPYDAGDDILLIRLLTRHAIPHEIMEPDPTTNSGWESHSIVMYYGPMLISIVTLFIAFRIYRRAKNIEMMLQSNE